MVPFNRVIKSVSWRAAFCPCRNVTLQEMVHGTKPLDIRWCLRRGTFLSPNKKVPKEVGLGGGAECRTPDAKAALPLRTLSRRAFRGVLSFFGLGSFPLYLVSRIYYLAYINF